MWTRTNLKRQYDKRGESQSLYDNSPLEPADA